MIIVGFSSSEVVISFIRKNCNPCSFISPYFLFYCDLDKVLLRCRFWETMLSTFRSDVYENVKKEDYCFEFQDDTLNDNLDKILAQLHGKRLMKDEYIDGEISRDICRTFPNHFIFRHKDLGGQQLLESVLRKISDNYFGLGYCQGMNYVVGTLLVGILDPELNGYYCDNDNDILCERLQKYVLWLIVME